MNKMNEISIRSLNNGYSEICVLNAGSGYWFLTASSANLLDSIDSYSDSRAESIFNYSNIVLFNTSFKETIFQNDGLLNLSIYSPALINDVLNFTMVKTVFGTDQHTSRPFQVIHHACLVQPACLDLVPTPDLHSAP